MSDTVTAVASPLPTLRTTSVYSTSSPTWTESTAAAFSISRTGDVRTTVATSSYTGGISPPPRRMLFPRTTARLMISSVSAGSRESTRTVRRNVSAAPAGTVPTSQVTALSENTSPPELSTNVTHSGILSNTITSFTGSALTFR